MAQSEGALAGWAVLNVTDKDDRDACSCRALLKNPFCALVEKEEEDKGSEKERGIRNVRDG